MTCFQEENDSGESLIRYPSLGRAPTAIFLGVITACTLTARGPQCVYLDGDGSVDEYDREAMATTLGDLRGSPVVRMGIFDDQLVAIDEAGVARRLLFGEGLDGGEGTAIEPALAGAIGWSESCAAFSDHVRCGERGVPLVATALSGTIGAVTCGLLGDGTVSCIDGPRYDGPLYAAPGLDHVVEVGAGSSFACARRDDGTVWCWGYDLEGTLGRGAVEAVPTPPTRVAFEGP